MVGEQVSSPWQKPSTCPWRQMFDSEKPKQEIATCSVPLRFLEQWSENVSTPGIESFIGLRDARGVLG
ncbi:unnamed protein product, partial [Nesidiocoris tenuis]